MIAAPRKYEAEFKSRLEGIGPVEFAADGGLVVDDGKSRVFVTRNPDAPNELEPERLSRIASTIKNPFFYSVAFSDLALGRRVLEVIADDPSLIVDNDHGVMCSGSDFVKLLRSRTNWEWRMDPP